MKKFFLIISASICFSFLCEAQKQPAFLKGHSLISGGLGIGNIWKTFLEDALEYPPGTYKVSSSGTFTLIYEYGFSRRFSGGVALGYSKLTGKFNGFGQTFTETLTNYSILARANYHFGRFKKFDPYLGGGLGYYSFKYYNNKPNLVNSKEPDSFGYSAQVGAHYYFFKRFGAFAELGYVGGSIAQLGITAKFY